MLVLYKKMSSARVKLHQRPFNFVIRSSLKLPSFYNCSPRYSPLASGVKYLLSLCFVDTDSLSFQFLKSHSIKEQLKTGQTVSARGREVPRHLSIKSETPEVAIAESQTRACNATHREHCRPPFSNVLYYESHMV